MMDIYLTDSVEEAIVAFLKDHEGLYGKSNNKFKDKARKDNVCERFSSNHNLSVKVCKTWFDSQRTHYRKLMQFKSGQVSMEITERQNWTQDIFDSLRITPYKNL